MKIQNFTMFLVGIMLILLSYEFFSQMNHAEKLKIENCDKISGTITEINKTFHQNRMHNQIGPQDGWHLKMKEVNYTIRIRGESFNALNHKNFEKFIKPGALIEVYILKPEYFGILDNFQNYLGHKDALTIICLNTEILNLNSILDRSSDEFMFNLIGGLILLIFGLIELRSGIIKIIESMKTSSKH